MDLRQVLKHHFSQIFLSNSEREFIKRNHPESGNQNRSEKVVLIQAIDDYVFYSIFLSFTRILSQFYSLKIHFADISINAERDYGKLAFLKKSRFYGRKWRKLYSKTFPGKATHSLSFRIPEKLRQEYNNKATKELSNIQNKMDLVQLKYREIKIGDLVYDTYLRFKPAPTTDINDQLLKSIIANAIHITDACFDHFDKYHIDKIFISYTSYIKHGILARTGLHRKIDVFTFGVIDSYYRKLNLDFPYNIAPYPEYAKILNNVNLSEGQLQSSRDRLKARFNGVNDVATLYMRQSAYSESLDNEIELEKSYEYHAIIFLHCFFDSPHIYRWMIFADFYEWLNHTLAFTQKVSHTKFYIKSHPNGLNGNEEIIQGFKDRFKNVIFLDKSESNKKIIRSKFDYGITVYGTVAHELPYFDIPMLCAGDNPHIDFPFCKTAKNITEYENYLLNPDQLIKECEYSKKDILKFYYMHNLYPFPGKLQSKNVNFLSDLFWKIHSDSDLLRASKELQLENLQFISNELKGCELLK